MDWDNKAKICGNCRFWQLSLYSQNNYTVTPSGIGGYHTDGSVSDCRCHAPNGVNINGDVIKKAIWPQTNKTDCCGDFKYRLKAKKP